MAATYCEVAVPAPLPDTFTYRIPEELRERVCVGGRVIVPFGARKLVGVVTSLAAEPRTTKGLKEIAEVVDGEPLLPAVLLELARWMTEYYLAPPGEVFRSLLPLHDEFARSERARLRPLGVERLAELERGTARTENDEAEYQLLQRLDDGKTRTLGRLISGVAEGEGLLARLRRQGLIEIVREVRRRARKEEPAAPVLFEGDWAATAPPVLTGPQERSLEEIEELLGRGGFATVLLEGVTGSGKTEVYSRAIQSCLERGRTALLLVPEIALTPAVAELFASRFGDRVAVLHSGLTPRERSTEWWRLRRGEARVAVGTRSAVFAPLEDVGVVIVDEEQDASYKQAETPRYHGRDTAVVRAKLEGALAILGSATPSLETSHYARNGKYRLLQLETRVAERPLAEVRVVDMRAEFQETKKVSLFSRALVQGIEHALASGSQALVLLNRRGYANFLLCRKCGATVQCKDCSISLVYHRGRGRLICPLRLRARAAEGVREVQQRAHPLRRRRRGESGAGDAGALRRGAHRAARPRHATARRRPRRAHPAAVRTRELDILVGTQMIAKGHDFQGVTLVGCRPTASSACPISAPPSEHFSCSRKSPGAPRGALPGTVLVQTYYPDHYAIRAGAEQSFEKFYEQELHFRRLLHYPRSRRWPTCWCATRGWSVRCSGHARCRISLDASGLRSCVC
jgi:primosomal protein N' (replication factor Y)